MFKKTCIVLLLAFLLIPSNVYAYSEYIYAGGENIGIEIKTNGVVIVGTYKINNTDTVSSSGVKVGDIIQSIDGQKITNIQEMVSKINRSLDDNIKLGYIRNNLTNYTNLKLYKVDDLYKTGLYVKDSITGIGTLTFIDPKTGLFGALGHEIIEKNSGQIVDVKSGTIFDSEVVGIERSTNGIPGEKSARYNVNSVHGNIFENTKQGIFGKFTSEIPQKKLYRVATFDKVKKGKANIFTVLNGNKVNEYQIEITKITNNQKYKNISFEILDPVLLKKTGGIVQGMSGSPIIQGDYIVGAVTHVVVDNPTKGYGILITNMLEEAEN
ncbi:MAG: SpoIVB peptidase S55 domain-containing protein [Bacilli bacterium]|nr:SpoIVB peptidase S55 domain-containing protein [Bacilli bacterium]MDD4809383.1 SpoIVB peptidase S55 domain-containing protein [Bacilli bacterium]